MAFHSVYLAPSGRFAIFTGPKCGSMTVRVLMWRLHTANWEWNPPAAKYPGDDGGITARLDGVGIASDRTRKLEVRTARIAVHRDPEDRVRSFYRNRIRPRQSFSDFCENMDWLSLMYRPTRVHVSRLTAVLGYEPEAYDAVLPTQKLHLLPTVVRALTGEEVPAPQKFNTTKRAEEAEALTPRAQEILDLYCAHDRYFGWDGKTTILPPEVVDSPEAPG